MSKSLKQQLKWQPSGTHQVSITVMGEKCACGKWAQHYVTEGYPLPSRTTDRHPFTAYLCCECFGKLFGPAAVAYCRGEQF